MSSNKQHCILLNYTQALLHQSSSICVLFISVMQSVNRTQFQNITFLLLLFTAIPAAAMFETAIVLLTSIYASQ